MTMMTGMAVYSEQEVIQALRNQLGNIGLAARELNVTRGQFYDYMVNHPDVMQEKYQIKEAVKDEAEAILSEKMKTDNALLMFFLRTQAQDRGYGTSATLKGDKNHPLQVNVNARTLIAAMRNGLVEDDTEEGDEVSDLFQRSGLLPGGVGS